MKIEVAGALGHGVTALAAFDDALLKAGIANYNLVRLSSVIPPGAKVIVKRNGNSQKLSPSEFGRRLYAVYAMEIMGPGRMAWAGLGWTQQLDGRGLFVEYEGENKENFARTVNVSLNQMKKSRKWPVSRNRHLLVGGSHDRVFTCALVVAKYQSQAWEYKNNGKIF